MHCRDSSTDVLQYVAPSGAYFIFVNIGRLVVPQNYEFPPIVDGKGKDWKICWYLCQELGVASVPGSGKMKRFKISSILASLLTKGM